MSYALEHALMMQVLIDMSPQSDMVPSLRAMRDEALEEAKAETAHYFEMSDRLFNELEKPTINGGGTIEIPLSYE
jgi:hypothetical protein